MFLFVFVWPPSLLAYLLSKVYTRAKISVVGLESDLLL